MTAQRTGGELDPGLREGIWKMSSAERESRDSWGNGFYQARLNGPEALPEAARLLADGGARLCMVTALTRSTYADPVVFLDYHFDVGGVTVTLVVPLDPDTEEREVPTITPWFRNADWHEREFSELYGVRVRGNANPRRLFLDPSIDEGVLGQIVPLTVMMNGVCTRDMWERVMLANQKQGQTAGSGDDA